MSSQPDRRREPSTRQGFLAAGTDPRGTGWRIQATILIGYLLIAAISEYSAVGEVQILSVALVAPLAWGLQWGGQAVFNLAFLRRAWWRRHPRTNALILLLLIIVVAIITAPLGYTDGWTVLWRWGITLVVTGVAISSMDYRTELDREIALTSQLQRARDDGLAAVRAQRDQVVTSMLDMLQEALPGGQSSADSARAAVTVFARERVRPLSHELMTSLPPLEPSRQRIGPGVGWRDVIGRVTLTPLIRPVLMALGVTVLFIFTTVQTTSDTAPAPGSQPGPDAGVVVTVDVESLLVSLLLLGGIFVITWGSAWVLRRLTVRLIPRIGVTARAILVLSTPIAIALAVEIGIQVAYVVPRFSEDLNPSLMARLGLAIPVVGIAYLILIGRVLLDSTTASRRRAQAENADLEWELSRINNTLAQERRFFATALHGPIQSVAASAALRLGKTSNAVDVDSVLGDVQHDLSHAIEQLGDGPPERRDVSLELDNLVGTWAGVCEVYVDVPDSVVAALDADWVAGGTVMDLLVDAVANAAMHGQAPHVWISTEWATSDEIRVIVVNDGESMVGDGRGAGTALLDESCVHWSRENVLGGVRLQFRIAVPRPMVRELIPTEP